MKVLVTGSVGFIGTHLTHKLLSEGHQVLGIDIRPNYFTNKNFIFAQVDINDRIKLSKVVSAFDPDSVIHLAARTDLDGLDLAEYSANTLGVENLLFAVRATPSIKRCIYTSSQLVCKVGYVPQQEYEYCPNTIYGQSKVITEKNVRKYNGGDVEWCLVRPTTIWGPGMSLHYQKLFRSIIKGYYFHIGRMPLYKSYGYVGNTVYQYIKLLEAPALAIDKKLFYLADYQPLSLRDWTNYFQSELNARPIPSLPISLARLAAFIGDGLNKLGFHSFPFNSFRLNNILTEYQFNLHRTEQVCGNLPYDIHQGVTATVHWLKGQVVA